ncbi:histamine H2 receptor-like [Amphiura filiformis]|uniref:histamine H2 receptor-like n=1 Tax=Amphiura filiformis TaxID=82378 RepID=UPI003B21A8AB
MNDSVAVGESGDPYTGVNPSQGYYIFQAIFLFVVMVITILGNVAVCYVVHRTRSITTVTGMCITSLAIADMLRGGLILPFVIISSAAVGSWQLSDVACSLLGMGYTLFGSASVMTLAAVSIDRYYAILKPLQYTTIVTTSRAAVFLCLIWILSLLMALLPIIGWSEYIFLPWNTVCISNWLTYKSYGYFYLTVSFFIPFSILVFCYYKIYVVARHQSRRVASLEMSSTQAFRPNVGGGGQKPRNKQRLVMKKEKKAAMTLFAVMGVFILCVTPYCIVHLAYAYHKTQNLLIAVGVTSMLSFVNSAANPLIYGILNRKFRRVFVEVMKCNHCPWKRGFLQTASSTAIASDAYTGVNLSTNKRQPIIPRDSGYITSATSSKTPDVFSISVFAATASTMATIGTNFKDIARLTANITHLPVIEDLPSSENNTSYYQSTEKKQRTLPISRPTKVFFNMNEADGIVAKCTEHKSDISESGGKEIVKSQTTIC